MCNQAILDALPRRARCSGLGIGGKASLVAPTRNFKARIYDGFVDTR